jgi:Beta-xylosidase
MFKMIPSKRLARKSLSAVLAMALLLPTTAFGASSTPLMTYKQVLQDTKDHWAGATVQDWYDNGLVNGFGDGTFRPNAAISRADLVVLLNNVFNLQHTGDASFSDVSATAYYGAAVNKAVAAGIVEGYADGTFRPTKLVTREEAAVMLFRAFQLSAAAGETSIADLNELHSWSKDAVLSMLDAGYIKGYTNGTFGGARSITRAEAVTLLDRIAGNVFHAGGEYKGVTKSNVVINTGGVTLKDAVIEGNLYITEGVGEGDVKLENVTVKGEAHINGGGENTVTVTDSTIKAIYVDKKNGKIRILTTGSTNIDQVYVLSGVKLEEDEASTGTGFRDVIVGEGLPGGSEIQLDGDFEKVEVDSLSLSTISLLQGIIRDMIINQKIELNVNEGGEIKALTIHADGTITVNGNGKVPANDKIVPGTGTGNTNGSGTGNTGGSSPGESEADKAPVFVDVSVHDPSIVKDNGTYYVFGSHLAAAKSNDLMSWKLIDSGVTENNVLFKSETSNVKLELDEALKWAQTDTLWAADVIELNGVFYMYYNACKGDSPLSAMGIATSTNIEGPYVNQGIFVKSGSGMTPDGSMSYNATIHPNAVDPDAFFDKDGNLWLVYGSYSGGIFIYQLDPTTGLPLDNELNAENAGFGKKLLGGNHSRIEAAYINYSEEEDYYYLYTTFGGLDSTGGYNMRVSRSEKPEGPYLDYKGQDMIKAKGDDGTFFDDEAIEPYGVKLFGNFKYTNWNADPNFKDFGYVSAGHNSVYYEEETGQLFNIFHSRFPGQGEGHQVRVHQMFMNEDGWPVVAPHRYAGEKISKVTASAIAGNYQFINHGKEITPEIKPTAAIELKADGSISGEVNGTWELVGDYYANLTIDGVQYKGVFVRQWDESTQAYVMAFSALSGEGAAVWGSQFKLLSVNQIIANVAASLSMPVETYSDLTFKTTDESGVTITWSSSNPEVISSNGSVVRPPAGAGNAKVMITAAITLGEVTVNKEFEVTVIEQSNRTYADGPIAKYDFEGNLTDSTGNQAAGTTTGKLVTDAPAAGATTAYSDGRSGDKALQLDGASGGVRLPDGLITSDLYTVSMWLKPAALTNYTTAFFGATGSDNWISFVPGGAAGINKAMLFNGEPWYTKAQAKSLLPVNEWTNVAFSVDNGSVYLYINGELVHEGTDFPSVFNGPNSILALGVNYWDTPYNGLIDDVRIYDIALTEEEIGWVVHGDPDADQLVESLELNTEDKMMAVNETYKPSVTVLPLDAANRKLNWSSDNEAVATVDASGKVTAHAAGKAIITAETQDASSLSASYTVTVINGLVAHYAFEDNLSDSTSNFDPGAVTGDIITETADDVKGRITFAEGVSGEAAVFDGESGIRLPNGLIQRNTYSVSMWLNPAAKPNFTSAFFGAQAPNSWISFLPGGGPGSTGNNAVLWSGEAWYDGNTKVILPLNEWSHVTFTVNEGSVKVYVDGVLKHSGTTFPSIFNNGNAEFGLGVNYFDNDIPYNGLMDEVKIYNTVLSSDEVAQQFAAGGFVRIEESSIELVQGETHTLNAGAGIPVVWSSANESVAMVDENGVVTAVGVGTTTITAVSASNANRTDEVQVTVILTEPEFNPLEDLIALLDFDGDVQDNSGNGNHAAVRNNRVIYVDGRANGDQAAQFLQAETGSPFDNIPVVLPNDLIEGDQAYTVAAWVMWNGSKDTLPQTWSSIYFSDTFVAPDDPSNYYLNMGLNGEMNLFVNGTGLVTSAMLPIDEWAHVAMTVVPGGKTTLYLNGAVIGQVDSNTRTTNGFNEHFIGGNFWDRNFYGAMDEFRMYDRALSEHEIAVLAEVE